MSSSSVNFQRIVGVFTDLSNYVGLVILIVLFVRWRADAPERYVPDVACVAQGRDFVSSATCPSNASSTCMRTFKSYSDGTCSQFPAPITQACTNSCHVATAASSHCDALGHCILGNTSECFGQCLTRTQCDADSMFKFNDFLTNSYDHTTFYTYFWEELRECFFGKCMAMVLETSVATLEEILYANNTQPYSAAVPANARYRCEDYLDPTYYATYADCLHSERFQLDPRTNLYSLFGGAANSTYPMQMEICVFGFKCARVDLTSFLASQSEKRSVAETPLTLERAAARMVERLPVARKHIQEQMAKRKKRAF